MFEGDIERWHKGFAAPVTGEHLVGRGGTANHAGFIRREIHSAEVAAGLAEMTTKRMIQARENDGPVSEGLQRLEAAAKLQVSIRLRRLPGGGIDAIGKKQGEESRGWCGGFFSGAEQSPAAE